MFNSLDVLYQNEICPLIYTIIKDQLRKQSAAEIEKLNREKKSRNIRKEGTSKPSPNKTCLVNKTTWTSRARSNTLDSNVNAHIPQWSEARSSEEEDIGMHKWRGKSNFEIKNEELKGRSSELEEIEIRKCSRRINVDIINREMKGSSSEEEYTERQKWSIRSWFDIINEEVKRWTSSSKKQEDNTKPTNTKEEIHL